jgi:hypothetical protein
MRGLRVVLIESGTRPRRSWWASRERAEDLYHGLEREEDNETEMRVRTIAGR